MTALNLTFTDAGAVVLSAVGMQGPSGSGGGISDGDKGDITVSGSGATWTIDGGAVSLSKMADLATGTILGRATAGSGTPEALTAAQVRTILNVANGATANSADAVLLARANHTGTQSASTITGLSAMATSTDAANLTGTLAAARLPSFGSGDASVASGGGAITIAADAVTNAKLANVATATLKGRATAGTGDPEDLSGTQATALLDTFTSGAKGLAPASGGGTTNFLRADGSWATPAGGGSPGGASGEVQYNNAGAFAGAADVEIEGGQLRLPAISTPTAPASGGAKMFGRNFGNAPHPAFLGPADVAPLPLQISIAEGNFLQWSPATGTGTSVWGMPAAATNGTATAAATDVGSRRARMKRLEYLVTVASTSALASWRFNTSQITIGGGNSWEGGFRGVLHGGPSTGVTNGSHRFFMGVIESFGGSDVNPSTQIRIAGIGYDAADTQVQFMYNDASGTATKIALGASFPKPNADRAFTYRLRLYSPPGTTQSLSYEVTYLETGAVATGTVITDLPATTDKLQPVIYASVGGVSSVVGIAVGVATFQTEPF